MVTSPLLSRALVFLAAPPIILNELLHTNRMYFGEGGGDHGSFLTVLVRGYMLLSMVFVFSGCAQIISFGVSLVSENKASSTRSDLSNGNDDSSCMDPELHDSKDGGSGSKDDGSDSKDGHASHRDSGGDFNDETDDDSDDGNLHDEKKEDSKDEKKEDSKDEKKKDSTEHINFGPPSVRFP